MCSRALFFVFFFFFFNDTATTEIYTLSLHDALPIWLLVGQGLPCRSCVTTAGLALRLSRDRKSTRLNSSHEWISYAVFCLKKKKDNISHDHDVYKNHKNNKK